MGAARKKQEEGDIKQYILSWHLYITRKQRYSPRYQCSSTGGDLGILSSPHVHKVQQEPGDLPKADPMTYLDNHSNPEQTSVIKISLNV